MDSIDDTPRPAPAGWLEDLQESQADLAAGRTVPGEVVMEGLRQTIAEMKAELAHHPGIVVPHH